MLTEPILAVAARDMTAFVIATIHLNLCVGTIARFSRQRPDLKATLDDLLSFRACGEFMLTEVDHGLDARNLETTATMESDGSFILDTPTAGAAKAMPPTSPLAGIARVAVVFARLIVDGDDRGVKPFVVRISDVGGMCAGVVSRVLPVRPGTKPLDHSITTFRHVRLRPGALLGSALRADNAREDFLAQIWRVSVGTLSLSIMGVSAIRVAGCIAAMYSQRRLVGDVQKLPILQFSTQQRPILKALAHGEVLHAYALWSVGEFMNPKHDVDVRRGIATVFKALVVRSSRLLSELAERCGWQGLYAYNQISELASTFQGNSVAEGDTLAADPTLPLALYEKGMFEEAAGKITLASGASGSLRGTFYNNSILPRCRTMVEAIGQRMAHEAAQAQGDIAPQVLDLFEKSCIQEDLSWFVEHGHGTRSRLWDDEEQAYRNLLPLLPSLVERANARAYITAPLVDGTAMKGFIRALPAFGNSEDDVLAERVLKSRL
ncbi:acyl-coenzyme A oxidase 2, peroxisomal [Colletotrichum spaethianum]|uniref:Acyl-coenzyme A oxidase 2, peroxisomal n=1 Tax=Colletotrichum spaethianum TaxID=700344 RepID=A0AA37PH24_9PEZI|nr:acyl-coenzyme A oxidase 2, peroxisomal [Colletotrichum spaethianum]GKT52014.1 acyl-coenzyme A oxidase 2, peroxisomal [Colletotrichum spaethianum]